MEIIVAIISALSAIIVSIVSTINMKSRKREEKRAQLRTKEFRLGMDMQAASIELADVIAIAVTGGHTNGNVEEARKKANEAKIAYYAFLNSVAAEALTSR